MNKHDPKTIWDEYQKGVDFNTHIDLYDNIEKNTRFYHGDQWNGVSAPSIELPVVNVFKPAIDYFTAMLVSDDVGVSVSIPSEPNNSAEQQEARDNTKEALGYITSNGIEQVFEQTKFKQKLRKIIKNGALDGDAYMYFYFEPKMFPHQIYKGGIKAEIIKNTNVIFGNPALNSVEGQPFIIVAQKMPTSEVKMMVSEKERDKIKADNEDYTTLEQDAQSVVDYTTVLCKFYKEENSVYYVKSTQEVIIKDAVNTKCEYYPIAKFTWNEMENCYHGVSPLSSLRYNQIAINKLYMMVNEFTKKVAFPKMIYNKQLLPNGLSNRVEALGIDGDPREAVFVVTSGASLPSNIKDHILDLIDKTKATLGVYDVALGNVRPENTSAIIALQKSAAQPLELQRLDLYQFVEDSVRIIIDIMTSYYGKRNVEFEVEGVKATIPFDYADMNNLHMTYTVDVGSSYYWSELTQIQTIDNLFNKQIIPDPITYLEQLPDGVVKNKSKIIQAIKKFQSDQQALAQMNSQIQGQMPALNQVPQV